MEEVSGFVEGHCAERGVRLRVVNKCRKFRSEETRRKDPSCMGHRMDSAGGMSL